MSDIQIYKCPYTDKPCYIWDCLHCEVEAEERRWMEELEEEDDEYEQTKDNTV